MNRDIIALTTTGLPQKELSTVDKNALLMIINECVDHYKDVQDPMLQLTLSLLRDTRDEMMILYEELGEVRNELERASKNTEQGTSPLIRQFSYMLLEDSNDRLVDAGYEGYPIEPF